MSTKRDEDKSGLDAIYSLGAVVRDARIKAGLSVDTVQWLTELYEGRGYSHEDAVKLANGETLPEAHFSAPASIRQCPECGGYGWPTAFDGCETCRGDALPIQDSP